MPILSKAGRPSEINQKRAFELYQDLSRDEATRQYNLEYGTQISDSGFCKAAWTYVCMNVRDPEVRAYFVSQRPTFSDDHTWERFIINKARTYVFYQSPNGFLRWIEDNKLERNYDYYEEHIPAMEERAIRYRYPNKDHRTISA